MLWKEGRKDWIPRLENRTNGGVRIIINANDTISTRTDRTILMVRTHVCGKSACESKFINENRQKEQKNTERSHGMKVVF